MTIWDEILAILRKDVPAEDFRRSFSETAYASDSGDQITVWIPTEAMRRHLTSRYGDAIQRISFYAPYVSDPDRWQGILAALRAA